MKNNQYNLFGYSCLTSAEKNLHAILENTREGIFLLDKECNIKLSSIWAREFFLKKMGVDLGKVSNFIHALPDWRRVSVRKLVNAAFKGRVQEYSVRYPGDNWIQASIVPIFNFNGVIDQVCLRFRDITAEKCIIKRAQKRDNMYHALVDAMLEGVVFQSISRQPNTANKSAAAILGVTEELLNRYGLKYPGFAWVDQKEQPVSIQDVFCSNLHNYESVRCKILGVKHNGQETGIKWIMINAEPVKEKRTGQIQGCLFTFHDITETIKTREELNLLSKVIKETSNMVVITDQDEKIIWANDSFARVSEYNQEEYLNQKPGRLLNGPEKDRQEVIKIKKALQKGETVTGEILNYSRKGNKYWATYNIHPVKDEAGRVVKYFSIQTDITELKRIQEQIIRQRLEHQEQVAYAKIAAQEEKQTEIGQELHDNINQILAVSKLYLGSIINRKGDVFKNAAIVNEHIQLAIDEIRKLSHRLVAPRFKEGKLSEMLKNLAKSLRAHSAVDLRFRKLDDDKISSRVKLAIYRIAQEQFNNINKHANASQITVEVMENEDQIKLTIKDDGVGFDKTQKSTGIGITNIFNRVESLRGSAEIDSFPGRGCKLMVSIPLCQV